MTTTPTRSLGAVALVLLARQIGDGARFAVFALAAWTVWPVTAGLGGAIGGAAAALGHGRLDQREGGGRRDRGVQSKNGGQGRSEAVKIDHGEYCSGLARP